MEKEEEEAMIKRENIADKIAPAEQVAVLETGYKALWLAVSSFKEYLEHSKGVCTTEDVQLLILKVCRAWGIINNQFMSQEFTSEDSNRGLLFELSLDNLGFNNTSQESEVNTDDK